jgi:voltage-gated potassium channel
MSARRGRGETARPLRLVPPLLLLAAVTAGGGAVLYGLGGGRWSAGEALYHAVNAVSTVGFRELEGMPAVDFSYLATSLIVLAGLGSVAYFQSTLTAVLVQGLIGERFRIKRMQKKIDALSGHMIIAGAGSTGMHVIEEMLATREHCVVIDQDRENLERLNTELADGKLLYVVGDATDDTFLHLAGIERCKGIVAALTEDKDNLFVTVSARSLNANARIVTKVIQPDAAAKMIRAGANATVSPNMIGGRRMASELVRPTVVEFIDQMLRDREQVLRLEEVIVPPTSAFVGKTLREVPIRSETNLLVVALRVEGKFFYNPEPSTEIEAGSVLVVLGESTNVARLRKLVAQ